MKKLVFLVLACAVLGPAGASALGQSDDSQVSTVLVGVVSVKGNEPFTFLALTQSDGRVWNLVGPQADLLKQHDQNAKVRVHALADRHPQAHGAWPAKAWVQSFDRLANSP